jgi:hypothetical protein
VFPVGNIYDAKFAYDLDKPLQPSDPASPLKNSIVMFTIDGDGKVVGGDVLAMKKTPSQVAGPGRRQRSNRSPPQESIFQNVYLNCHSVHCSNDKP